MMIYSSNLPTKHPYYPHFAQKNTSRAGKKENHDKFHVISSRIPVHASTINISLAYMSIRYTKGRCFVPFPRSSCDSLSFSINIGIWNQQPAISGVDLHETSDTHQVTNKCSKAAKLSINKPPHIISERRWCTDVVAGRTFVQTVVTLVIWSFKKDKISPPKMIT